MFYQFKVERVIYAQPSDLGLIYWLPQWTVILSMSMHRKHNNEPCSVYVVYISAVGNAKWVCIDFSTLLRLPTFLPAQSVRAPRDRSSPLYISAATALSPTVHRWIPVSLQQTDRHWKWPQRRRFAGSSRVGCALTGVPQRVLCSTVCNRKLHFEDFLNYCCGSLPEEFSSDNQVPKSKSNGLDGDIMAVQRDLVNHGHSRSFKSSRPVPRSKRRS